MKRKYKEHVELINQQIKELVGIYRDVIKHLDITESEFWIWYTLVSVGGARTQQDICNMWSLPKQTVNTVITRMRLKKYAYLEAVPGSRNHKVVRLTDEGMRYGEALVLPVTRMEAKACEKISHDELSLVNEIFGKYIEVIRGEFNGNVKTERKRRRDIKSRNGEEI